LLTPPVFVCQYFIWILSDSYHIFKISKLAQLEGFTDISKPIHNLTSQKTLFLEEHPIFEIHKTATVITVQIKAQ